MRRYRYVCDTCDNEEVLEQKVGSPRSHNCPVEGCTGTSKRRPTAGQETAFVAVTPGVVNEMQRETRNANKTMAKLREKAGHEPIMNKDHMAAERHAGRKNGIVPGGKPPS